MEEIVIRLINSIIECLLVLIIPFICWLIFSRKKCRFFKWLGLKKPYIENKRIFKIAYLFTIILFIVISYLSSAFRFNAIGHGMGMFLEYGVIIFLIHTFLGRAFIEEVIFRGFLGKRLIHKVGFPVGNLLQALIFGVVNGIMFKAKIDQLDIVVIILYTSIMGWIMGWINEKQSDGSIIPSWMISALCSILLVVLENYNIF